MSTPVLQALLDPATLGPASRYVLDSREALLSYETDELAALRFSIILTARWESSDGEEPEARAALRADLELLRRHYGDKLDDIAMTFGVAAAMTAKQEVERNVVVPRELAQTPSIPTYEELCGGEEDGGEFGL